MRFCFVLLALAAQPVLALPTPTADVSTDARAKQSVEGAASKALSSAKSFFAKVKRLAMQPTKIKNLAIQTGRNATSVAQIVAEYAKMHEWACTQPKFAAMKACDKHNKPAQTNRITARQTGIPSSETASMVSEYCAQATSSPAQESRLCKWHAFKEKLKLNKSKPPAAYAAFASASLRQSQAASG